MVSYSDFTHSENKYLSTSPGLSLDFGPGGDDDDDGWDDTETEDDYEQEQEKHDEEELDEENEMVVEVVEEEDGMAEVIATVLAGVDPLATPEQEEQMRAAMTEHFHFISDLLVNWAASPVADERRNAQMVVGFMQLHQITNPTSTTQEEEEEIIPKNAPPSLQFLLNANQRAKIERLAMTFKEKYAVDFYCRRKWPKLDGIMVHINEVKPNKSGTGFKDVALKTRKKTQVCVLGASEEALERFRNALQPNVDEESYNYFESVHVNEFCAKLMEDDKDEEEEDGDDEEE